MSWEDEFRGFFFGEGYLGICRNGTGRNGQRNYEPRAQITLRADDIAVLEDIRDRLGGAIHYEARGRVSKFDGVEHFTKPYACWRVRSRKDVERVCDILDGGYLPSKKRSEVDVMRRYFALRMPPGPKKEGVAESIREQRELLVNEIQKLHGR